MNLSDLDRPTARLVQIGLRALGHYKGTTGGVPGPKTKAAYSRYLAGFDQGDAQTETKNPLPGAIVEIAQKEIGVEEVNGTNSGKRVQEYQAATWLDGTGWPWCAAFVCWVILQAGKRYPLPFERPRTAGAFDFERWAKEQGLQLFRPGKGTAIKAGDIVIFNFSHIGIATHDQRGQTVQTVEGNTDGKGAREGGGVFAKTRKVSQIRSFIRLELA